MTVEGAIITALGFITISLIGLVGYLIKDFIEQDREWKKKASSRSYDSMKDLETLKTRVIDMDTRITHTINNVDDKLQNKFYSIQNQLRTLDNTIETEIRELKKEVHNSVDTVSKVNHGKILMLEKKVNAIYDVFIRIRDRKK